MTSGAPALVGVTPDRAAGYAVREGQRYANRTAAGRAAADAVRAVLTNGRGGLRGDEMAWLPHLEIVCAVGAGDEAVDLDAARRRGTVVAPCPGANAPAAADAALRPLPAATRHLLPAERLVRAGGWQERWRVEPPTITGKRLGILGLGNIGRRIAPRAASPWRAASTPGRRSPEPPSVISPVPSSSRRGPMAWSPPRRGARGRGTSSARPCSPRSDRRATSPTSGAGRSWMPGR